MSEIDRIFGKRPGVKVERKRPQSKPGDPIRSGRVESPPLVPAALVIVFEQRPDGCLFALLGKAEVGVICAQDGDRGEKHGFNWLCTLPEQRRAPQFAATIDKAKGALESAVKGWCETALLVAAPKRRARCDVVGWRADA